MMNMLGNNKISCTLIHDPKSQNRIKQIDIMYQHIINLIEEGKLALDYISNAMISTNGFTKALHIGLFKNYLDK